MKKMLNRSLFAVLTAVLVTVALVISCGSPLDGISGEGEGGGNSVQTYKPPAGMGYIMINLGNKNNARATFMPEMTDNELEDLYYYVDVTDASDITVGEIGTVTTLVKIDDVTNRPIAVGAGTYKVKVYASTTATMAGVIATGEKDGVSVAATTGGSVTINLVPDYTAGGTGQFYWLFALPTNFPTSPADPTATLTVTNLSTNTKVELKTGKDVLDLTDPLNLTGTATLGTGYYQLEIIMEDEDDATAGFPLLQYRRITHVVHIANGVKTSFTPGTLPDLNRYAYNVVFDHNDGASGSTTKIFQHGKKVTAISPSYPAQPTYSVIGWYKTLASADDPDPDDPDVKADLWNFNNLLINDLDLFARWGVKETLNLAITLIGSTYNFATNTHTFHQSEYNAAVGGSVTLSDIEINVTIPSELTLVEWVYNGKADFTPNLTGTTLKLTNNDAGVAYLAVGTHTFTAKCKDGADAYHYPDFTLIVAP